MAEETITLERSANIDDPFVTIVERILNNTLPLTGPEAVYVILVDNWFDHKWLEFKSRKTDDDSAGWRQRLWLPPFEPSRILNQASFSATAPLRYQSSSSKPLHILQSRRSVDEICQSGVFLWYSYVDEKSDRGSLMVYLNRDKQGSTWYASFTKRPDWRAGKIKGISKREFTDLATA